MAESIPVAFVHGYTAEIHRLSAQRSTKLRNAVRVKTGVVGKSHHFERLGASNLQTLNTRHGQTPILNPVHSRRRATFTDKGGAILLDRQDEWKMLIQPENDYAQNHADSVNRFYDDLIIAAATGNSVAVDENDATSNVTLASWAGGAHVIASGATGLTFEKVNQATRVMNSNEGMEDEQEDRYWAVSPQAVEDLLAEVEVSSSDFSNLNALQNGTMAPEQKWMGAKWIMSNRLAVDATPDRTCLYWHKKGMGLAIAREIKIEASVRDDLSYAKQVYAEASAGAVRIEEARVLSVGVREV
jgi:hypothetical protein